MKRIVPTLLATIILFIFITGCATPPQKISPSISNFIGSRDFQKYRQIAVLPFADAPGAPQSGQIAQGLATQLFAKHGFIVMERGRLYDILSEQQLSVTGLIDENMAIRIGKILGVSAIVVGVVGQYSTHERHTDTVYIPLVLSGHTTNIPIQGKQWTESFASVSIRVIDIETSQLIYSGSGQYDSGLSNPPQQLVESILKDIIAGWTKEPDRKIIAKDSSTKISPAVPENSFNSVDEKKIHDNKQYHQKAIDWTEKSINHAELRNWSEMIRTASAAIAIDPSYPEAYVNRSWAYLEKGFPEKALADCNKALSLDGNNTGALNNRGLFYLRQGLSDKAKDDFLQACNGGLTISCENYKLITGYMPSEKTNYLLNKAEAAFNAKNWDEVIRCTSEIPDNATALSVRAGAYAYKGMLEKAIKDCDQAIMINPDYALPYNNKAFALELKGNNQEAMLNYEFACNLKMAFACDNLKRIQTAIVPAGNR